MSSSIRPRALVHSDREGDPLDGLVNLFDLGVVLAVAFLLAALASLDLTGVLTRGDVTVVRSGSGPGRTVISSRPTSVPVLSRARIRQTAVPSAGSRIRNVTATCASVTSSNDVTDAV